MDLYDLKRQATAARESTIAVAPGKQFTLRVPTRHQVMLHAHRAGLHGGDDAGAPVALQRALLLVAVVGWAGITVADVLGAGADALDWHADAVETVLDAQPDWDQTLGTAMMAALAERNKAQDTAAKNSVS